MLALAVAISSIIIGTALGCITHKHELHAKLVTLSSDVYEKMTHDTWAVTYRVTEKDTTNDKLVDKRIMLKTRMPIKTIYTDQVRTTLVDEFRTVFKVDIEPIVECVVLVHKNGPKELMKVKKYHIKLSDTSHTIVGFQYSPSINDIVEMLDITQVTNHMVITPLD